MKQLLKEIFSDFYANEMPIAKPREINLPIESGKIITLIGPRRSGKSFIFYYVMNKLIQNGISKKILYILILKMSD